MPSYDFRGPRLFVDAPLAQDGRIELDRDQSNYLGNVLRLAAGAEVLAFNGRDGEWQGATAGRERRDGLVILRPGLLEDDEAIRPLAAFDGGLPLAVAAVERQDLGPGGKPQHIA